jgi:hypothetical protein
MAMGTRKKRQRQEDLWVVSSEIVGTPAHACGLHLLSRLIEIFKIAPVIEMRNFVLSRPGPKRSLQSRVPRPIICQNLTRERTGFANPPTT